MLHIKFTTYFRCEMSSTHANALPATFLALKWIKVLNKKKKSLLKTYNIKKKNYPFKIYNMASILGAHPPSIVPEVDGCGLLSLQSVVL